MHKSGDDLAVRLDCDSVTIIVIPEDICGDLAATAKCGIELTARCEARHCEVVGGRGCAARLSGRDNVVVAIDGERANPIVPAGEIGSRNASVSESGIETSICIVAGEREIVSGRFATINKPSQNNLAIRLDNNRHWHTTERGS